MHQQVRELDANPLFFRQWPVCVNVQLFHVLVVVGNTVENRELQFCQWHSLLPHEMAICHQLGWESDLANRPHCRAHVVTSCYGKFHSVRGYCEQMLSNSVV